MGSHLPHAGSHLFILCGLVGSVFSSGFTLVPFILLLSELLLGPVALWPLDLPLPCWILSIAHCPAYKLPQLFLYFLLQL